MRIASITVTLNDAPLKVNDLMFKIVTLCSMVAMHGSSHGAVSVFMIIRNAYYHWW